MSRLRRRLVAITVAVAVPAAVVVLAGTRSAARATTDASSLAPTGWLAFTWAPDVRGDRSDVYLVDATGRNRTRLTRIEANRSPSWSPAWSPDGARIAYVSFLGKGEGSKIWVMRADGGGRHVLTSNLGLPRSDEFGDPPRDSDPTWSPDERRIAFVQRRATRDGGPSSSDIWAIDTDGGHETQLTSTKSSEGEPQWSPDGTQIAFLKGNPFDSPFWSLYVMNADGVGKPRLLASRAYDDSISWSPDGTRIAFTRYVGRAEVFVVDLSSRRLMRLTRNGAVGPTWSPDGRWIAFSGTANGEDAIYAIPARGGSPRLVTRRGQDPAWRPSKS